MNQHLTRFFLVLFILFASVSITHAQARASENIDQMLGALGGQAFLDVKDIHTAGRFFGFSRGQLSSGDLFSDYIKFPDMERTEFGGPKNKSITVNRGKEGSKVEGKKDPDQQTPGEVDEFVKGFKTSFDYVLRFVVKDRQTTVQNLSSEIIDFKRTDVVELRDAAKNRIRFYIDRDTHLPVKMQVRRNDDAKLREEQYANWHKFQGVMTPMFVSRYTDSVKTMEIRAETVAYNSGLSDNLFTPLTPAK
jgi:outer membrane lipoprotein-sorting protein